MKTIQRPVFRTDSPLVDYHIVIYDFSEEISRGVAWLDENAGPEWFNVINLDELKLEMPRSCVLGQLAMERFRDKIAEAYYNPDISSANYWDVTDALDLNEWRSRSLGFSMDYGYDENDPMKWEALTLQWKRRIQALREAA